MEKKVNRKAIPKTVLGYEVNIQKHEKYLFCWDNVPGNDIKILLRFLRDDLDIDWSENAEIRKSGDGKTIRIFKDENSAEIMIDEKEEKATLKVSDGRTHDLKVKKENGKLNIYYKNNDEYYLTLPAFPNIKPIHSKSKGRTIRDAWEAVQKELDRMEKKGEIPPKTLFHGQYHDNLAKRLYAINREISKFGFYVIAEDLNEANVSKLEKICDKIQNLSQVRLKDKNINEQIENEILEAIIDPLRSADQRALNMVGLYMKVDHLKEFSHLVEQAYFNFFSAEVISTTMVLVPVIEGLLLSWYGFDLSKGHSLPEDNQLLNFVAEQECIDNQMIHPLMVEEYIRTFVYTYKNIFHASHEEAEEKSFFNLNFVQS